MHDPSFLAWEIRAPWPVLDRWATRRAREGHTDPVISRRTNEANLGERVYPWWSLKGYRPRVGHWCFRFPPLIEVWHEEPGGCDMGSVCEYRNRAQRRIRWTFEHRSHLHARFMPGRCVRAWLLDRCEDCGHRFRWRESRIGTGWDAPGVLHDHCHDRRTLKSQKADLVAYVRGEATDTQRWRVEYTHIHSGAVAGDRS